MGTPYEPGQGGNPYQPFQPQQPYQQPPQPYAAPDWQQQPPPGYQQPFQQQPFQQQPFQQQPFQQMPFPPQQPPTKKRRKGWLIAAAAVVILGGGGATAAVLLTGGGDDTAGAISDLKVAATDKNGEATVSFTRPSNTKALILRCTYTTAGKAAQPCTLPGVDPAAKTVQLPLKDLPAGQKTTVSIQACNHTLNASGSDADKYCSDPATATVLTNAPPGAPTGGTCKADSDGTLNYTWAKPSATLPSPVAAYQISFDDDLSDKVTSPTFSKTVPKDGAAHTVRVAAVDSRGVAGTATTITCKAPNVLSHGTFSDPLIDRKPAKGMPTIDLTRVDWSRSGEMLTVKATFSTKGKPFIGLMIDADADGTTGKHGMKCPDKPDDLDFGAEYIYVDDSSGLTGATADGLCDNKSNGDPGRATATHTSNSISITVDLDSIDHDPDKIVIRSLAGADSATKDGVFTDYAPKASGQGIVIPLPGDGA